MKTGVKLIPFEAWHTEFLTPQEPYDAHELALAAYRYEHSGLAFSALAPNGWIGSAGLAPLTMFSWFGWLLPGPEFHSYALWAIHTIKNELALWDAPIYTYARDEYPDHRRLVEMLGFVWIETRPPHNIFKRN